MSAVEDPDREQLETLFGRFETTGCIVTASYLGLLSASIVTFITPCSLNPPRLVVCTRNESMTNEVIEQSRALVIHPLARGQEEWVAHFSQPARDANKFESVKWRPGVTGTPILEEAVGYVEGEVIASLPAGDHTVRMIEPVGAVLRDPNAELLTLRDIVGLGLA